MLKQIKLENFKSHKDTTLDFCSGVNVIIGRGQAGKTNVKRALEWLCFNRISGAKLQKIHSKWCGKRDVTRVTVVLDNGFTVSIIKPVNGKTSYELTTPNGKTEVFERDKYAKVPEQVSKILALDTINIQGQLDQPYLVTEGSSELSKQINMVTDLESADVWLKELNSRKLATSATLRRTEESINKIHDAVKSFEGLDKIDVLIKEASTIADQASTYENLIEALDHYISTVQIAEKKLKNVERLEPLTDLVLEAEKFAKKIDETNEQVMDLGELASYYQSLLDTEVNYARHKKEYMAFLKSCGVCPMCFSDVTTDTLSKITRSL
jgi:DNA repair protein SbcC/Rad50